MPAKAHGIKRKICFHWACRLYQVTANTSAKINRGKSNPTEGRPPNALAIMGTTMSPTPDMPVFAIPVSKPQSRSRIHCRLLRSKDSVNDVSVCKCVLYFDKYFSSVEDKSRYKNDQHIDDGIEHGGQLRSKSN